MSDEQRDPNDGFLNEDDRPGQNLNRGAGQDGVAHESLALRVRRLEDIAFEGDGLTRAVTRLGLNASALGEALLTVDRNQQQLTKLGQQLEEVDAKAATKEDLAANKAEQDRVTLEFRKRTLARIYTTGLLLSLFVATLVLVGYSYSESRLAATQRVCEARTEQNLVLLDVLERTARSTPPGPDRAFLESAAARLRALDADCEDIL